MAPEKKRRKVEIEEIKFDPAARQEYLTGFHKRKQERIQTARATAAKKAKEEKLKERRQIREQRKEDLDKHIAAVKEELRKQNPDRSGSESGGEVNGDEGEWGGIGDASPAEDVEGDEEFVDEEKYTSVTVEAMPAPGEESEDEADVHGAGKPNDNATQAIHSKRTGVKDSSKSRPAKKKRPRFRYESKAERAATRQKQKTKGRAAKAKRKGP